MLGVVGLLLLAGCTAPAPPPSPAPTVTSDASPPPTPPADEAPSLRVVDGGPIEGAMGEVTVDTDGTPLTYTVVEGDTPDQIRARFDIWWDQLADADGVRLPRVPTIYVGDVLTFTGSKVAFEEEPD